MKLKNITIIILTIVTFSAIAQKNTQSFYVINEINIDRVDSYVEVPLAKLNKSTEVLDVTHLQLLDDDKIIPFQINKEDGKNVLSFVVDVKAKTKKKLSLIWGELNKNNFASRTYAELAMKLNANYSNGKFHGTKFSNVSKIKVPSIHLDHDALFKYEGPGWESEKVGYRFYLDWRNATDIFGKKVNALVLKNTANNDTLGNNDDSYHSMLEWGMDIFKVGNSLGIGSIAMMSNNKVNMVSKTDSTISEISQNGPITSEVKTNYYGWMVDQKKYDLESKFSINAGSRLTKHVVIINNNPDNLVTGLAKHEDTKFVKVINKKGWSYIALYGKQSLAGDSLGIAILFNSKEQPKITEDELSYIVKLKPINKKVTYYFCAAWEQELNGIKSQKEFETYLNNVIQELNNPIKVEI